MITCWWCPMPDELSKRYRGPIWWLFYWYMDLGKPRPKHRPHPDLIVPDWTPDQDTPAETRPDISVYTIPPNFATIIQDIPGVVTAKIAGRAPIPPPLPPPESSILAYATDTTIPVEHRLYRVSMAMEDMMRREAENDARRTVIDEREERLLQTGRVAERIREEAGQRPVPISPITHPDEPAALAGQWVAGQWVKAIRDWTDKAERERTFARLEQDYTIEAMKRLAIMAFSVIALGMILIGQLVIMGVIR